MGLRKAIDEKCKDCIYDSCAEGTWKKQVEMCSMPDCPLYPYRPVTEATRKKNNGKSTAKKHKDRGERGRFV